MKIVRFIIAIPLGVLSYPLLVITYGIFGIVPLLALGKFFFDILTWNKYEMQDSIEMVIMPFILPFHVWRDYVLNNKLSITR